MNANIYKATRLGAIFGLAFGALITSVNATASDNEIILHDAIHDYENGAYGSFGDTSPQSRENAYRTSILLDEAQLDYVKADVEDFNSGGQNLEQADFAAFEESVDIPWELTGID